MGSCNCLFNDHRCCRYRNSAPWYYSGDPNPKWVTPWTSPVINMDDDESPMTVEEREDIINYVIATNSMAGLEITREQAEEAFDKVYALSLEELEELGP